MNAMNTPFNPQQFQQAPAMPQQPQAPQQFQQAPAMPQQPQAPQQFQQAPAMPQQPQAPQQFQQAPAMPQQLQAPQQFQQAPAMPQQLQAPQQFQQAPAMPQQPQAPQQFQPQQPAMNFAQDFADTPDMHEESSGGAKVSKGYGLSRLCAAIYTGKQHYTSRAGYKVRGEMQLAYELIGPAWPEVDGRRPVKREVLNYSLNARARMKQRMTDMDPNSQFRSLFQMVGNAYLIELAEEVTATNQSYIGIKSVRYPVVQDPVSGQDVNYAANVPPPTVTLMAFNYDRPMIQHWDSLYIDGTYDDGGTKNSYQNAVRCAVDFETGPVAQMLTQAGRDLYTDYVNGMPVDGSRDRNIKSVTEWVAFKQGRGPFPGGGAAQQDQMPQQGFQPNQQAYGQAPMGGYGIGQQGFQPQAPAMPQQPQAPQQFQQAPAMPQQPQAPQQFQQPPATPQQPQAPQQFQQAPAMPQQPQAPQQFQQAPAMPQQPQAPQQFQQPPATPQQPQAPQQFQQAPAMPQQPQAPQQFQQAPAMPQQPQAPQQFSDLTVAGPLNAPGMPPMTAPQNLGAALDDEIPF
ncbi:uncharacterized protein [Drosophila takahashii]|uniref:uncharacterized protein n=1 Tax=Drosophila takahashii TaxID=29030 RepID=UPI001CF8BC92|nr:mediator of RNA polymerase II transcription subunit 15-like [Drosophila takahashii]